VEIHDSKLGKPCGELLIFFVSAKGKPVDATRELCALGMCNIIGSFVGSMPVSASFGRTSVNVASGARTPLGGLFTGTLVLSALTFLMPFCAFIPRASLASIVIGAVIFNIDLKIIGKIWQTSRLDLIPYLATLLGCLFWRLEYGILLGIGINLAETLYVSTLPMIHFDIGHDHNTIRVKLDTGSFIYPAANSFRNALEDQLSMDIENCYNDYVLDFTMLNILDYTTLNSIIVRPFSTFNLFIILINLRLLKNVL
jgi:sodium-independent sulfate anion transporter 11